MKGFKKLLLFLVLPIILMSCDRKPELAYLAACAHPDALKEVKYYVKHKISDAEGLLIAAKQNTNEKIVEELLKSKNIEESKRLEALWTALDNKNIEVFNVLLKATKGVNSFKQATKETILMNACVKGKNDIVELLIKAGADVNAQDEYGRTALMIACREGNKDIVNALLAASADIKIKKNDGATAYAIAYTNKPKNKDIITILEKTGAGISEVYEFLGLRMVSIPGKNFEMLSTEVTQEFYEEIMGDNPSYFKGERLPAERVSWFDAVEFCNTLSTRLGLTPVYTIDKYNTKQNPDSDGFRLPTVEEWQYAARGGENYDYAGSNDIDKIAWYYHNSGGKTHPVGQKKANGYGLYDMSGNVFEWCWNASRKYYYERYICGGSWQYNDLSCFVDYREGSGADSGDRSTGFRIVRNIK
ncbi:MAG: SUMF1/EgtB/PvdO family nonheme iron enzyme [Spirochaetia bacterium]|nr:SUMF1/EgtB/PvdO family nonheme iron enzyme [Spirochaetia bacterium]